MIKLFKRLVLVILISQSIMASDFSCEYYSRNFSSNIDKAVTLAKMDLRYDSKLKLMTAYYHAKEVVLECEPSHNIYDVAEQFIEDFNNGLYGKIN
jgi:hypothetical protein